MSRIEVLSGPEQRRRWSAEEKRSIVAEACSSVCAVARRRDVVPGQIIGGGMSFGADSGDCGQGFRLIADSDSDPSRTAFR